MKTKLINFIICLSILASVNGQSWIRTNQLGYLPRSVKVAVFLSTEPVTVTEFRVCEALSGKPVYTGRVTSADAAVWGMQTAFRMDFSKIEATGGFYLVAGNTKSGTFRISPDVYSGTADYILNYMRQQRCGFNPYLNDSCHTHDGFIVDHPTKTGKIIDVKGGWHDASDYLQYQTTSANAVYQMLFAYTKNPDAFGDQYNATGLKTPNGIPDILDEARWGLDWLVKMNPDSGEMYNQIADDRDHQGFRLPNKDVASYGKGLYRPVYFVTGKPQGLGKFKNRTTGVSSTAGKYCSSFALAAQVFKNIDPPFAEKLTQKATDAFEFALTDLGETQTACTVSPYFYEEGNYIDDLELASYELYKLTGNNNYLTQAKYWGALEPITPWMERGFARHYQYYPFVNLGHANLALAQTSPTSEFSVFMKSGLEKIREVGKNDPFQIGIPFIWCSNNLVVAAITHARLYFEASGDSTYIQMEAALRDWLFGCNPWGTTMICGLPAGGDYPLIPHSSITKLNGETTYGGLVDGPVYRSIYENLKGITLFKTDMYAPFQLGKAVYHDDLGDYSTNEPTMDGTASLSFYLSFLEKEGKSQKTGIENNVIDAEGALIRKGQDKKQLFLIFSADEFGDGTRTILDVLKKKKVKASFFLTGNYLRNAQFQADIERIVAEKHYLGAHSNRHLLYAPWDKRDSTLVSQEEFESDLKDNYMELNKFGIDPAKTQFFLAPYEWYNKTISHWSHNLGLELINFTPGSGTNADYTTPDMKNYKSSEALLQGLMKFEISTQTGLNGAIILIHAGSHPDRTDKFYNHLGRLIDLLRKKGYSFERF